MSKGVMKLMSQDVFEMPIAQVLMILKAKGIPQHEITLSNGDEPIAAVMFLLDAETIRAVKKVLADIECKQVQP